jgi:transposase
LTSKDKRESPEQFAEDVKAICDLYKVAPALASNGTRVMSTDEKTGMQALERAQPTKPPRPGSIERIEFEYVRHGTLTLIANWDVAKGGIVAPSIGPTRTEQDFVAHIAQTVDSDPDARWIFITDRLNTHMSPELVKLVADRCGLKEALGKVRKSGVLESMPSRRSFLEDKSHRIRFVYTPRHCSWLNQIELWFSILVRKLLSRSSFSSVEALSKAVLAFIEYFNAVLARPFKWTYRGRPLQA